MKYLTEKQEIKLQEAILQYLEDNNYRLSPCPFPRIRQNFPKERAMDILNALTVLRTEGKVLACSCPQFPATSNWILPWRSEA